MKKIKIILYSLISILVLTIAVLYSLFLFRNVETKAIDDTARKNADGQFIQLPDGITHFEAGGPDSGQTVLLVHGFSVPYYIWGSSFDSLVKNGFHVIRYDEFGRGFSDRPATDYNPLLYRKQLLDLIRLLHLKTPINIVGVSFGGAVISDFVTHYPDLIDKIILIDPVFHFRKVDLPEILVNFNMAYNHEKQATGQLEDFKYPQHFPGWADRYKVQMQYKGFRHALISTLANYPPDSIMANYQVLDRLGKNILLIWGRDDQTVPFQFSDSLRKILHADFLPVEDAGHLPFLEQPALVDQKIITFLRR
jgi:pimeloyl-ACP methyl ester carboxylesterase